MSKYKIGFIGAGNMATALIKGLIQSKLYSIDKIVASDNDVQKLRDLSGQFNVDVLSSNKELVQKAGIIVLAVKPQIIRYVLEEVKDEIGDDHLVISIAAGIPTEIIHSIIQREIPLIRVMPNTPALVQKGVSAIAAGHSVTSEHMRLATGIFEAVGRTVIIEEKMMDAVTALSGSGPGYVFKIMECLVEAGERLGFDKETSLLLVVQTVLGAAHLANESKLPLSRLRAMVTSPGGTTAAGLAHFDYKGLQDIIIGAVEAACARSVELGRND